MTDAERIIRKAKLAYQTENTTGSDDKDVFGADVFCVSGAEVDSAKKRLALSYVSLKVSAQRYISRELGSMLSGSWISCLLFRCCVMSVLDAFFAIALPSSAGDEGSELVPLPTTARQELSMLALLAPLIACRLPTCAAPTLLRPSLPR